MSETKPLPAYLLTMARLFIVCLVVQGGPFLVSAVFASDAIQIRESDGIDQRGKDLRAALQKLCDERNLSGGTNDITTPIQRFFPKGTTFSEAEAVLNAAGFTVGLRPNVNESLNPNRSIAWYGVLAEIPNFVERFPFRIDVYINLIPKAPGDYTTVAELSASIIVSGP